jgi:DNA-binding Lrp family transcriptional regulator|tara:strand:- start:334 stop:768 length:435 start_codon:yes stop_codon:yes gene_type:complete
MITDESDKRLLSLLRRDARISIAELARKLYLSRSTVKDRITRLEKRGVIKGYSLLLGDDYNRGKVSAHILATLESNKSISMTVIKLKQFPQITKAYAVSGIYDLIVILEAQSTEELDGVLDQIRGLEGIKDTLTNVVLSTKFES